MYDISVEYNCLEDLRRGRRLEGAEEISETFETETIKLTKITNSNGQARYEANLNKNILLKSFKIPRLTSRQDLLLLRIYFQGHNTRPPFLPFPRVTNVSLFGLYSLGPEKKE